MSAPMTAPVATVASSCTKESCGGTLELGELMLHTAAVVRHRAECRACGKGYVLTVTLRPAKQSDRDPWSSDG